MELDFITEEERENVSAWIAKKIKKHEPYDSSNDKELKGTHK